VQLVRLIPSWAALTLTLATVATGVRAANALGDDARPVTNNGQDPTRPRTQLEVLYEFQNLPGPAPDSDNTFTFRAVSRVPFDEHWSGSLRIDVPLDLTNPRPPRTQTATSRSGWAIS
jgi:hypothetical protein